MMIITASIKNMGVMDLQLNVAGVPAWVPAGVPAGVPDQVVGDLEDGEDRNNG